MKKTAFFLLSLFIFTGFLSLAEKKAVAESTGQIICGDYQLVTRTRNDDGKEEELLYRINTKTGETWMLHGQDIGWVKLREQK